ncbi:hypothetical protein BKA65DRAFT_421350 [Rhexocercosporidium sp. MPI-PUGE-AT-0058]|nr:hypothetical protein BKA65DRAFT_421350 [Rhexocercosporidium sp. MPI-PUGE-AT-0058]
MEVIQGDSIWLLGRQMVAHANSMWNECCSSVLAQLVIFIFYALAGTKNDLLFILSILVVTNSSALISYILTILPYLYLPFLSLAIVAGYLALVSRSNSLPPWPGPGQPYLIPCRTTHTRLFPRKHSFSYSYLTVGIPVGFEGSANGIIGANEKSSSSMWDMVPLANLLMRSWYSVQASEYLLRGHDELGLRGKLDSYLQSEGLDPGDFPHAYLVTAPKFAGYNFNPVSFWYLYSADRTLSAMILEVNNTYDEKRPYLVHRDFPEESKPPCSRLRIKGYREKDLYVSPFNSRKGQYTVSASDPLGPGMDGFYGIDITITLKSSKGNPKLVARLFSEGKAVDPYLLGSIPKVIFLARWFWVGFATVPRIVKEAIRLLYRRKLQMQEKPEPLIGTLGRHATSTEQDFERCFRRYLEVLIHRSKRPLFVKYSASGFMSSAEEISTPSGVTNPSADNILELRILTPKFYSRLIQYDDSLDGIISELIDHKTIWVSKPELLQDIFIPLNVTTRSQSFSDMAFVSLTKKLRQGRPSIASSDSDLRRPPGSNLPTGGVKHDHIPVMEAYMAFQTDSSLKMRFQWAILRQLFADQFLMGRVDLVDLGVNVIHSGIAWIFVSSLSRYVRI